MNQLVSAFSGWSDVIVQTSFMDSPLLTAIPLHLLSWRLATTLILPDLPEAWKWPFDATTLIGTGVGLICSWAEVWALFALLGFGDSKSKVKDGSDDRYTDQG